tara:strand:- start:660 stop:1427 length:768 start_codon:yes stop_codon:yes gene_type:complete
MIKTPLKSTNIQNKSLDQILKIIPEGAIVDSYLFFSGHLEFSLAQYDRFVCAHTNKYAIYEFWHTLSSEPKRIYEMLTSEGFKFDESMFSILQEKWVAYKDPVVRSALFFMLNQMSETGAISHGKLINKAYNPVALADLRAYKNISNIHFILDKQPDFLDSVALKSESEYTIIPVGDFNYNLFEDGKNEAYDTVKVDHRQLKNTLSKTDRDTLLIYNFSTRALAFYKDYKTTMIDKYGNITKKNESACEIIVANF